MIGFNRNSLFGNSQGPCEGMRGHCGRQMIMSYLSKVEMSYWHPATEHLYDFHDMATRPGDCFRMVGPGTIDKNRFPLSGGHTSYAPFEACQTREIHGSLAL